MSKELEALNKIKHASLTVVEHDDTSGSITIIPIVNTEEYETIKNYLTPPTADEVCEALSEQLKTQIKIGKNKHGITFNYAGTGKKIISLNYDLIHINVQLPYNLITLIGPFYEAQQ